MPGRKDQVYIGKCNGKSEYKTKHYLLGTLKDLLGILNRENTVDSIKIWKSYEVFNIIQIG